MSSEPRDFVDHTWVSNCCGAPAWGEVFVSDQDKTATGICSRCHDHCCFDAEPENDREFIPQQQRVIEQLSRPEESDS